MGLFNRGGDKQGEQGDEPQRNPPTESGNDDERSDDDPRNIGDQNEETSASARGAEVDLSPEEREEQIKSAAPDGGEIEDTPTWEEALKDERRSEAESQDGGEESEKEQGGSRVSVVDESPPRPEPPDGVSDDEYKWHTYKVYPSGRPDAVEFIDTYKSFGRSHILRGLNMGLPEGMVSMILGPSGTGKSVCIKHMVGLLYPDKGDCLVHGNSVPNMADDDLFDMRKKFGLLFQDGALFGSMNLFDNVAFPLRQHTEKGEDEVEDIVMRRLNEVGLASALTKMPNELSGGMRKRAGFARALVLEPDIVLFDEPDSGLDPVRTALLGELILEIHRDMMDEAKEKQKEHLPTFCVITHDIMSARRVADYINVLWKGRIVEAGPAEDMLNSENPFIRQFLSGESQGPLTMD
jgi:phospholipid/cholesterol/gamma-HCH transport system ATP-binding protein